MEKPLSALSVDMVDGSLKDFGDDSVILGKELAKTLGSFHGDRVKVVSIETSLTPLGPAPRSVSLHAKTPVRRRAEPIVRRSLLGAKECKMCKR